MQDYKRGSHTVWACKYRLVWVTRYRYPVLAGDVGQRTRELLRDIGRLHEMTIYAGSINRDHVHMLISIPSQLSDQEREDIDLMTLTAPACFERVGREMKIVVPNADGEMASGPSLLRIIARAHDIQARLIRDTRLSVHDVARSERVSPTYVYTLLRLPWLVPDITAAIVNARQPAHLTAKG